MAGAIAILVRNTLRSEFRRIDPALARIVLVDMGKRVLGSFSEKLSSAAKKRLEELGVEALLGRGVEQVDEAGVVVAGELIASNTVIWTAGVSPSPAARWLKAESDRAGRVRVQNDLTVPGHPGIFVVGDTASFDQDGKPPHSRKPAPGPFRYFDKGVMAVVGKGFAVLQSGRVDVSAFLAWLAWAAVHLEFLAQSSLRVSVFMQWEQTRPAGPDGEVAFILRRCDRHCVSQL